MYWESENRFPFLNLCMLEYHNVLLSGAFVFSYVNDVANTSNRFIFVDSFADNYYSLQDASINVNMILIKILNS